MESTVWIMKNGSENLWSTAARFRVPSLALSSLMLIGGCSQAMPDRAERMTRSYVYYLDGAGGGGLISNWAGGVREGLLDAGYNGAGEIFRWNTGMGIVADQTASVEYKRGKAAQLAREITEYQRAYPNAPITLIGLSAGTAVVAFTLEALPPQVMVDTVVMLSGSLSSDHDLTKALRHVRGKMYVFTSQRDEVLGMAVPLIGTADRKSADGGTIGMAGPRLPRGATSEVRDLYRKIVKIPWNPGFERYGDYGRHTDTVKAAFVQAFVAPLVLKASASRPPAAMLASSAERIANPDYQRWSKFPVGAWADYEGYQIINGQRQPFRMKAALVSKTSGNLLIHREFTGPAADLAPLSSEFFVVAQIDPRDHPLTHPAAIVREQSPRTATIGGRSLTCQVRTVRAQGEFPVWGRDVEATLWTCPDVTGGIVQFELSSRIAGQEAKFFGRLVDWH